MLSKIYSGVTVVVALAAFLYIPVAVLDRSLYEEEVVDCAVPVITVVTRSVSGPC